MTAKAMVAIPLNSSEEIVSDGTKVVMIRVEECSKVVEILKNDLPQPWPIDSQEGSTMLV